MNISYSRTPKVPRQPDPSRFPPRCLPPLLRGRRPRLGRHSQRLEPQEIRAVRILSLLLQVQTLLHPAGQGGCRTLTRLGHSQRCGAPWPRGARALRGLPAGRSIRTIADDAMTVVGATIGTSAKRNLENLSPKLATISDNTSLMIQPMSAVHFRTTPPE